MSGRVDVADLRALCERLERWDGWDADIQRAHDLRAARTALPRLLDALDERDRLLALAYDYVNGEHMDQGLAEEIALLLPDSRATPPDQGPLLGGRGERR